MTITTPASSRGLTLIDAIMSITILGLSMMGFLGVATSSKGLQEETRQAEAGNLMVRQLIEQMRGSSLQDVVAMYNTDPTDDPMGDGTAPSGLFDQSRYQETVDRKISSPYGTKSVSLKDAQFQVILPINNLGEIREDMSLPALGFPRDLNGDGVIDQQNQLAKMNRLPVSVQVRWTTPSGPRTILLQTVLGQ